MKDILMPFCQQHNPLGFLSFSLWDKYSKFSDCLQRQGYLQLGMPTQSLAAALNQFTSSWNSEEWHSLGAFQQFQWDPEGHDTFCSALMADEGFSLSFKLPKCCCENKNVGGKSLNNFFFFFF